MEPSESQHVDQMEGKRQEDEALRGSPAAAVAAAAAAVEPSNLGDHQMTFRVFLGWCVPERPY